MRLTEYQIHTIKTCVENIFGSGTTVRLFGSRTNDELKGGDIDLYIEPADSADLLQKRIQLVTRLQRVLGEQKLDIVIASNPDRLIEQQAIATGICL